MDKHILKEIEHVGKFLPGVTTPDLARRLALSMSNQIKNLPLVDTELATKLKDAVMNSSYDQEGKTSLCKVIEDKLLADIGHVPPAAGDSKQVGH